MAKQTLPKLLTLDQVSKLLKVHKSTLRRWDNQGRLKSVRVGPRRDRRYEKMRVMGFIARCNREEQRRK